MKTGAIEVAIVGAGPYGLSIAAYLAGAGIPFRIFGTPMQSWQSRMPVGMHLKSDGFASSLYDPKSELTLGKYSASLGLPYQDVGYPVPIETFINYGHAFQKRFVGNLERTDVTKLRKDDGGFQLTTASGEELRANSVVVAVGITHFGYVPPPLSDLDAAYVTHSSEHCDVGRLRGKSVAIVGAGASAVDLAALMHQAGVDVQLIARRAAIAFHDPPKPRSLLESVIAPRSGLGLGWKSRLCTDAPLLFHAMPLKLRLRAVQRHLGPAPGWFVKDKVVGLVPLHLSTQLKGAVVSGNRVQLRLEGANSGPRTLEFDHVVAGTGYRIDLQRLKFLDQHLRTELRTVHDAPVLNTSFESSVPGLYFVGLASAYNFGPLARFAYGAGFTAKRITKALVRERRAA